MKSVIKPILDAVFSLSPAARRKAAQGPFARPTAEIPTKDDADCPDRQQRYRAGGPALTP